VPRATRSKDNKLENAMAALQKKLGRVPAEDEIAEQLGLSLEEYFKLLDEARCVPLISTEDLPPDYLERYSREDIMEEISAGNPLSLRKSKT
jgi:RNA polymerase sigma factor for flagellar operon FliA